MTAADWTVELRVERGAVAAAEAALADICAAVAAFESADGSGRWLVTGYATSQPDAEAVTGRLVVAGLAAGVDLPPATIRPLPPIDWLTENRRSFAMVRAGRYRILSLDDQTQPPPATVVLRLNAGPAFGSGSHETTRGCLLALDELARRSRIGRVLDLGTGSGILAIAAARTWPCAVLATDIDPVAVATARENAARNGVARQVTVAAGPGIRPAIRQGRFDLVLANIQARPLCALAVPLARVAAEAAPVILSGILAWQEAAVLARYRVAGFRLERRVPLGEWVTLLLHAGRRSRGRAVHSLPDFGYSPVR